MFEQKFKLLTLLEKDVILCVWAEKRVGAELSKGRVSEVCRLPGFKQVDLDPALVCEAALRGDEL
jgi:hypothetical protein